MASTLARPVREDAAGAVLALVSPPMSDGEDTSDKVRLLLIGCDDRGAQALLPVCRGLGFEVERCRHLDLALAQLRTNTYGAALLDVAACPAALELMEEVRRATTMRQMTLVALVAPVDVADAFRAGANFTVPQPANADLLKNTLSAAYRTAVGQRRHYARYPVDMPVLLKSGGYELEAKATDIGHGGMALVASVPFQVGEAAVFRFILPGTQERIDGRGEVRWSNCQGRAGIRFIELDGTGQLRLDNWLARRHMGEAEPDCPAPGPAPAPAEAAPAVALRPQAEDHPMGRWALGGLLVLFCMSVIAFWIYVALTS